MYIPKLLISDYYDNLLDSGLAIKNDCFLSFTSWVKYSFTKNSIVLIESFKNLKFDIYLHSADNHIIKDYGNEPIINYVNYEIYGRNSIIVFHNKNEMLKWKLKHG